jgi:hypothetical protein
MGGEAPAESLGFISEAAPFSRRVGLLSRTSSAVDLGAENAIPAGVATGRAEIMQRRPVRDAKTTAEEGSMAKLRMLITATAEQVKEPFLWRLGKDYNVVVNVKRANFTEDGGYAYVELEGSVEEIQRATAWLQTTGMIIEPEDRSLFPEQKPG